MKKKLVTGLVTWLFLFCMANMAGADAINYSNAVLADNPYAYWKLDEISGNTAYDSSTNNFNGILYGNPNLGDNGAFTGSNSIRLNGTNYIEIDGTWGGASGLTIEAWYRVDSLSNDFQVIMGSLNPTSFAHLQLNNSGNIVGYTNTGAVMLPIISENPLNDWLHVAVVLSSGHSSLYLNGAQIGSSSHSYDNIVSTDKIRIGNYNGVRSFHGSIDDVSIFNYALTQDQVQNHFNAASVVSAPVPVPATIVLFGLGLLGLTGVYRKQTQI